MYQAMMEARAEAMEAEGDTAGAAKLRAAMAEQAAALEADRKMMDKAVALPEVTPEAQRDPRALVAQDGDGVADAMDAAWQGGA